MFWQYEGEKHIYVQKKCPIELKIIFGGINSPHSIKHHFRVSSTPEPVIVKSVKLLTKLKGFSCFSEKRLPAKLKLSETTVRSGFGKKTLCAFRTKIIIIVL